MITTHYIEEARQANVVGMMRFGRLLAEGHPDTLLDMYERPTLEDVFLHLCLGDEDEREREKEVLLAKHDCQGEKSNGSVVSKEDKKPRKDDGNGDVEMDELATKIVPTQKNDNANPTREDQIKPRANCCQESELY